MTCFSFLNRSSSLVNRIYPRSVSPHVIGGGSSAVMLKHRLRSSKSPCIFFNRWQNSSCGHYVSTQSDIILDEVDMDFKDDTIFALSSGVGGSTATAVAVIRITGPESHEVLKVLMSKSQSAYKHVKLPKARYASLRMLYDPNERESDKNNEAQKENERIRDPLDSSLVLGKM